MTCFFRVANLPDSTAIESACFGRISVGACMNGNSAKPGNALLKRFSHAVSVQIVSAFLN